MKNKPKRKLDPELHESLANFLRLAVMYQAQRWDMERKTAVCLGNWHEFLEQCRRAGTKFTPVFVWGVNCI